MCHHGSVFAETALPLCGTAQRNVSMKMVWICRYLHKPTTPPVKCVNYKRGVCTVDGAKCDSERYIPEVDKEAHCPRLPLAYECVEAVQHSVP